MMELLSLPWLEAAILIPLVGAVVVSRIRDPFRAAGWGLTLSGITFACALFASFAFGLPSVTPSSDLQETLLGHRYFHLDNLSLPFIPIIALLHFLTALATPRIKMRRFSYSWSLAYEGLRLMTFACSEPWLLVFLLVIGTVPPLIELLNRGKSPRIYILHMGLFALLLVNGWAMVDPTAATPESQPVFGVLLLLMAVLVLCGTFPAHCWVTDWFENASFGNALLFVAPLTGVYAAVRLVLPIAPDWVLQSIGVISLITAVYAAAMATIQIDSRRFLAFLFLSYSSMVLVGLELTTPLCLTGALRLWSALILSLGGFGITLRALEARIGRVPLNKYHGLYEQSPVQAVCFLMTGLATVGFPGTASFIATDLLVDGAVHANVFEGFCLVLAAALNGIAVLRVYFLIFTGTRHTSAVSLKVNWKERIAVLTLAALILGGGVFPQPAIESRHQAAEAILEDRSARLNTSASVADRVRVNLTRHSSSESGLVAQRD
jgi:NADH-quinone oxidoreductase subunit M